LLALVVVSSSVSSCMYSVLGFGAEIVVLGGNEGLIGVDGSSEVDGESWE